MVKTKIQTAFSVDIPLVRNIRKLVQEGKYNTHSEIVNLALYEFFESRGTKIKKPLEVLGLAKD